MYLGQDYKKLSKGDSIGDTSLVNDDEKNLLKFENNLNNHL